MDLKKQFKEILKNTRILKNPKHRLSTFGQTKINYFFISQVGDFKDRSRLREGLVIAEKPQIITPELFRNRFEGFGDDSENFSKWLSELYGETFQGLEYKFRNESRSTSLEYSPLNELAEKIEKRTNSDEYSQSAVVQGPDKTWEISMMNFIVDECIASFKENMRELDEHGFFDTPEKTFKKRKEEVEDLILKAAKDRSLISLLERKLQLYGLFKDYEDDFYRLIKG